MSTFNMDSIYTILASIMSANGLISNNITGVIGSMLVSPYGNPLISVAKDLTNGFVNINEVGKLSAYIII